MARFRRVWVLGFRAVRLGLGLGIQVPAVLMLAQAMGGLGVPIFLALAFTLAGAPELARPWDPEPRPRHRLALALAFYAWWASCLAYAVLAPLAWGASRLFELPVAPAQLAAALLAVAAGVRAVLARPRLVTKVVRVDGLPAAFEGYRIAQLSDVHCGPYTPARRVQRWVERINRLEVDLVAVTGDLIASGSTYVRAVATALGSLRARDGVFACLGNHEYFTDAEAFVRALGDSGLRVLRNAGVPIERGESRLFVAGTDDTWTGRSDVDRALARRPEGVPTVLLAHDPNVFPAAAARGVDVMLSGHTHGGQLGVPGLSRRLNLGRLITRYPAGLYRQGSANLYVSRGAGTSGPPIRLGAPSEITVLVLKAA